MAARIQEVGRNERDNYLRGLFCGLHLEYGGVLSTGNGPVSFKLMDVNNKTGQPQTLAVERFQATCPHPQA